MNDRHLFSDQSEVYARSRPGYPVALYEWLSGLCDQRRAVWDVGCGSGQASFDLSGYFDRVEATDVSESQIENAPAGDRVHFTVQPAESTDFGDHVFDAVCVAQALHWFDHERFWPEVRRVLRPSGIFAAWGYVWPHIDAEIDGLLGRYFLDAIQSYWPKNSRLLWDGYKDVPIPFERISSPELDMTAHWTIDEFFSYLHSWSATRRCMEDRGEEFFTESYATISKVWNDSLVKKVSMDFIVVAGRNSA